MLSSRHATPGGTVTAFVRLEDNNRDRIREVLITGDFFVAPPRTILDLEAALRGAYVKDVGQTVESFFETADVGFMTVKAADLVTAVEGAVASS